MVIRLGTRLCRRQRFHLAGPPLETRNLERCAIEAACIFRATDVQCDAAEVHVGMDRQANRANGNMSTNSYIIRGGLSGRERLRLLARVMRPATLALFDRAGVRSGMQCMDIGCGGGDASIDLARLVGPTGHVTGIDFDPVKIELARQEAASADLQNITFQVADVAGEASPEPGATQLVYARFLLTHLQDPEHVLARWVSQLDPGGLLIVEDIQISGHIVHPPSWAHDAFVDLYRRAAHARGADPDIGPRLPGMLQAAGLQDIQVQVAQPVGLTGDMKQVSLLSMEAIADAVIETGLADHRRISEIVAELKKQADDPQTLISIARVIQCWGRKPTR